MLVERFWAAVTVVVSWFTMSPFSDGDVGQVPIGLEQSAGLGEPAELAIPPYGESPIFYPPSGSLDPDDKFKCDYSQMAGGPWYPCSDGRNRECWLRNNATGQEWNIHTNYEDEQPKSNKVREYWLDAADGSWSKDGVEFAHAKLFNQTYPGPWIQACWGDTIRVHVKNNMTFNGTSIHWHGIRQKNTMHMDGVNGVTQCPIAPGDSMTYEFETWQYGSSWYHSHYSVQYADGLQGPMTIHGPSSAPYDAAIDPLLMTDWNHESAFAVLAGTTRESKKTILLNGQGNATNFNYKLDKGIKVEDMYQFTVEPRNHSTTTRAKRYLFRLINTSFDTTFVFSIDNHWLQVVGADFVPIEPYWNTSVLVGIGQRYHVIVEADPDESYNDGKVNNTIPGDRKNFWIRTWVAKKCGSPPKGENGILEGYEKTGILRYDPNDRRLPTTQQWPSTSVSLECSDETYSSLVPKIPWYIGPASNTRDAPDPTDGERYDLTTRPSSVSIPWPHARLAFSPHDGSPTWHPLRIDYGDPTWSHVGDPHYKWKDEYVVLHENYTRKDWVYLVLAGKAKGTSDHPIHLHGHDFAILQQESSLDFSEKTYKPNFFNPPRRDVVLLPTGGFVVIAFKVDNPGMWLMHCHIARHASFGLATQILERQTDMIGLYRKDPKVWDQHQKVCKGWNDWVKNCTNWWPQNMNEVTYIRDNSLPFSEYPACKKPEDYNVFDHDSGI